ncbi:MAG TPA: (Fe-S)-binding protein [Burkholderiaceae bacterium]|jgi:L-lactate dehydrogenase complex protein LldE
MRVGLFFTCLIDTMRPEIGFSVLKLLESAGCEVVVPESQTCCSQPAYNSGDRAASRALAEKFVAEFEQFDYVVIPSGSCGGMVRVHYADLFAGDPAWSVRMQALAPRVFELTEFLYGVLKLDQASIISQSEFAGRVTYHDSCCGLRELGVQVQPRALLGLVPGLELREMKDCRTCCGFGGTFSVKYGDVSTAIVDEKCVNIRDTGADAVVLGDLGCMLNIEGRLRRTGDHVTRVLHVAEVLAGDTQTTGE